MNFHDLIPSLQVAIGPVILISGVGMLLLVMTNRFGRVVDRVRQLARESRSAAPAEIVAVREQAAIFLRRAGILRLAIALAAGAALLAGLLIICLFFGALRGGTHPTLIITLFAASIACLLGSLGVFLFDIQLSLRALLHEVSHSRLPG